MSDGLRARIQAGEALVVTFVKSEDPAIAELLGLSGFDVLIADLEHSTLSLGDVAAIERSSPVPVLVRVPRGRFGDVGRLLEAGVAGVQVPDVRTSETLAEARAHMRFGSEGIRGLALSHRAGRYGGVPAVDYIAAARRDCVLVAQVESAVGVEALGRLVHAEDTPDVWLLGPTDLSADLGRPGETQHPEVEDVLMRAADTILAAGQRLGAFAVDEDEALRWRERGATFVAIGSDVTLLAGRARQAVAAWRAVSA